MKKRGQVTIFIIVGIVIIGIVALFFLFRSGVVIPGIGEKPEKNPNIFLQSCIEDKVKEAVEIISSQGGYINNSLNKTFLFKDETSPTDISYLCYNQNDYLPCINQEPMLIQHLENEMHDYISDDVRNCFNNKLTKSLDKQGYVVDATYRDFEVALMRGKIIIEIDAELTLTKTEETSKQEDFKIIIPSRFYDTALVVREIIKKETEICNFDYGGYMVLYPEWKIDKFVASDSTKIYTIKHKDTAEKFRFSIRGCVIPPGY